jgi:hypothetical protein
MNTRFLVRAARVAAGAVTAGALLAGCSDSTGPVGTTRVSLVARSAATASFSTARTTSQARPSLAAAPLAPPACGSFLAAGVTISQIYLQGQGGRTVLRDTPATVDLCNLAAETLALVDGVNVPSGTYNELRLVITGGFVQLASDGTVYATDGYPLPSGVPAATGSLQLPSWGTSGLKVDFAGGAVTLGTEQRVWALDFDVEQSFGRAAGASGQWVMGPIVKLADLSFTGSVEVKLVLGSGVTLPTIGGTALTLGDFSATADNGTTSVTQAFDATSGSTTFYLPPSATAYTISLVKPSSVTVTATSAPDPPTATITEGAQAPAVTFTLQSVVANP